MARIIIQLTCLPTGDTYIGMTEGSENYGPQDYLASMFKGERTSPLGRRMSAYPTALDWTAKVVYVLEADDDIAEKKNQYLDERKPTLNVRRASKSGRTVPTLQF